MKCPKCGNETDKNICPKCGYDMSSTEVESYDIEVDKNDGSKSSIFETIFSGLFDDDDNEDFPVDVFGNEFIDLDSEETEVEDKKPNKKKSFKDFFKRK